MPGETPDTKGQPGLVPAALFGLCPQCGGRTLFDGAIQFAPRCRACGLDYGKFNVGDGPAAFLTLIVGALIVALAIWVEVTFEPPFWVHAVLWTPLTVAAVTWGLRMGKSALLYMEFSRDAGEGRLKE